MRIIFIQHLFGELRERKSASNCNESTNRSSKTLKQTNIVWSTWSSQTHTNTYTFKDQEDNDDSVLITAGSSECIQLHSRQVFASIILLIIIGIWTHTQFIWESNTHLALSLSPICHELFMAHIVRRECTKKYSSFVELCGCKLSAWCGPSAVKTWSLW